jgi:putative heme-binding domain-containing protein
MPKVLVSDPVAAEGVAVLRRAGFDVDIRTGLSAADLKAIIGDYDALAVRSETKVTADILEAAATRESLKSKLATLQTNNTELLEGGDVTRGRDLVTNHLGANCIACHTVEAKEGSQVGPNLKTIGSQKDRAYLLESLLNPLAQVAPGYGLITLTLKDGKNISAVLDQEDAKQIRLKLPDGKLQTVPLDQIAARTPPISVMPPMLGILTKSEIRDVVAYLASLKAKTKK